MPENTTKLRSRPLVLIHDYTGRKIEFFDSIADACRKYHLDASHVSEMLDGKRRTTRGFYVMSLEDYQELQKERA